MKSFLFSVSIVLVPFLLLSCKEQSTDLRGQYVGTYDVSYTLTSQNLTTGKKAVSTGKQPLSILKGSVDSELTFIDPETYQVSFTAPSFTIKPFNSTQYVNGTAVVFAVTGGGYFQGQTINISYTGTSVVNGQQIKSTTVGSGVKL